MSILITFEIAVLIFSGVSSSIDLQRPYFDRLCKDACM